MLKIIQIIATAGYFIGLADDGKVYQAPLTTSGDVEEWKLKVTYPND